MSNLSKILLHDPDNKTPDEGEPVCFTLDTEDRVHLDDYRYASGRDEHVFATMLFGASKEHVQWWCYLEDIKPAKGGSDE